MIARIWFVSCKESGFTDHLNLKLTLKTRRIASPKSCIDDGLRKDVAELAPDRMPVIAPFKRREQPGNFEIFCSLHKILPYITFGKIVATQNHPR